MAGQAKVKSGKTFRYQAITENFVGCGTHGRVFKGHFKPNIKTSWEEESDKEKNAAIKRVEINYKEENWMEIENDREFVALKELRHPCIVRLFAVEDDDNFRNYVFELCQANLEDFITKKYDGLNMPVETEGLYQMVSGLKFIHEKNMIHRDIKPENVLIYLHEEGHRAMLKISDLGFTKPLKEDGIHYDLASGLKGTEHYMAPELLLLKNSTGRVLDKECTIATDVFAAGCTFFRYLNGGLHPFGKGQNVEVNIMEGKPINATSYGGEPWITDLLAEMVKFNPKERPSFSIIVEVVEIHNAPSSRSSFPPMSGEESLLPIIVDPNENYDKIGTKNVGDVEIDRMNLIGTGAYSTVFAGTFKGEKVAVKRVQLMDSRGSEKIFRRSLEIQQLLNHRNVVQFKHFEKDDDFGYFVMELCAASLQDFIYGKYQGPMPTDVQVLFQLANGLEYIHSQKILHRGVKPENILISKTKPVEMKWSNFGSSKPVNERGSCSLSGIKGTQNWLSPEEMSMLQSEDQNVDHRRGSVKSEIFSAGCVFIFFLLRGKHPFGKSYGIPRTIFQGRPVNELPEEHFARPFVLQMIENDPENRISLRKVIDQLKPLQPAIQLSSLQYDSRNLLCSTGTLSIVYHVGTFEGSPLAVKRVPWENCTTKSFEKLEKLKHPNIIRLLHDGEDEFYKYFGMELCVASLDQLFLPKDDPKKYNGLIPSDDQFCFQLISGLEYIHEQNLVHGSIKPTNILISPSKDPQIKLSDFGFTTSCLNDGHSTKRLISGFLSSQYWLAPELLESDSSDRQCTKESDIFAAGSVFFYFLSKGCHLFGVTTHQILKHTCEGNQFNLIEKMTVGHFAMGLIRWMTHKDPTKRPEVSEVMKHLKSVKMMTTRDLKTVGTIQFSRTHFVDKGGQGSVYLGSCEHPDCKGVEVVIKRIYFSEMNKSVAINRELAALRNLSHPNIVKFFDSASDEDFRYIAIEKCLTSLDKYCRQPLLYQGVIPMPTDQQVLLQMAKGLHYIHSQIVHNSQPLIHRDVKPENILISCDNPAAIKWADFGLSRAVVSGSKSFTWSQLKGTDRWLAPELIQSDVKTKVKGSQRCDVFALGCVFFFFLKQGMHPFEDEGSIDDRSAVQKNIKIGNQVNLNQLSKDHFAFSIIEKMIQNEPHSRPKMSAVVDALQLPTQQPIKMPQELLGEGAYGIVMKRDYIDRKGNRYPAAFKKCNRDLSPDMDKKFDQEIETLRELKHLFVVKYIDVVVENDTEKFIVMELCEGSVKDYVEGNLESIPKDSLDEKILVGQVALGLAYIHDKGIIHKDLKLENILLKRHSPRLVLAKIADFGFAKELKPGKTEFSKTERPGTETYMAPELLNAPDGAYPASFASDVYALGITIARIVLKGEHPYSSNKLRRQISMLQGRVPPNLQGLSWDLIELILKLTEKDPRKRPDMVLVLRHPYFVLTNDKTKKHFVDQLWNGLQSLSPEDRSKQVKKIFSNRNFQQWYHNISGDKPATKEEMEKMAHTLPHYKTLNPDNSGSDAKSELFTPAKKYEEAIKEAITSEYDPEVGNQINQMSLISSIRGRFCGLSRCRLYKLIQRSPKLLVPYFWSHLLDVVNESVAVDPQTGVPMSPTKAKHNSAQSKHKIVPELEWSSLYYDNEQVVDELWNIKYSENYADSQKTTEEIIGTIAKCNVSESVWSDLLDKIGNQRGISLLSAIVESHSSNVVNFVDIFLQRFDVANLPARIHILVASNEGDFAANIMQVLLNHGLDSKNAVSKLGMTPVHYAAQNESSSGPKLMKILLENGGDPNRRSTNHDKSTPIQLAASNQGEYAAEIFKLLLDRRCACDELSAGQFEPIHFATMNSGESAPELLDLLLKKRGVSVVNRVTGMSLVHFTMFNNGDGGPIIAKKLFKNGAKPNARDKRKQTPLHLAARDTVGEKNQIAIMTVFLQNGGDPNVVDELGRTPVHYAAANEGEYALEKLKLLKDYRGNLAARDKGGLTPVHYTILNKGASGAEMRQLVGYKKGTNIPLNNCGETLLHRLVNGIHNQIHLVQTALESGVNPNVKDIFGCSPVHDAVTEIESGVGLDILKLLLQNGGDPNLPDDKNQQTPVHYAAYSKKEWAPKQMEILLSNGGNANAIGTIGYTPLHLAAMNTGNYAPKLTSLLLKSNGNANAVDNCGRSPVHVAVLNENDDTRNQIIKELLENGGNANARDKDGRTPLYYAIAERPTNSLLKNVLIKYGGNMAERDNHGMTPN